MISTSQVLILFDIDGTLTRTGAADTMAVGPAFERTYGFPLTYDDWNAYGHITDSAIPDWELRNLHGRGVMASELEAFGQELDRELSAIHSRQPEMFQAVRGANAAIQHVQSLEHAQAAIATGCLKASALFKLRAGSIDFEGIPAGFAEDGISREEIVLAAIDRASDHTGATFSRILSIGDGLWDIKTAANLGLDFLGIDAEGTGKLKEAGAEHVMTDYSDFINWLDGWMRG